MTSPRKVVRRFRASDDWRKEVQDARSLASKVDVLRMKVPRQEGLRKEFEKNLAKLEKTEKWLLKEIPQVLVDIKKVYRDDTIDNSMVLEGEVAELEEKQKALTSAYNWVSAVLKSRRP